MPKLLVLGLVWHGRAKDRARYSARRHSALLWITGASGTDLRVIVECTKSYVKLHIKSCIFLTPTRYKEKANMDNIAFVLVETSNDLNRIFII